MVFRMFFAALLAAQALPALDDAWRASLAAGKESYGRRAYTEAARLLAAAVDSPEASAPDESVLDALRLLAGLRRAEAHYAEAAALLARALNAAVALHGPDSPETAAVLSELAGAERLQGRAAESLAALDKAIRIREAQPSSREFAADLTAAAALRLKAGETDAAIAGLRRAVETWDAVLPPGDPQCLPALEALANAYRDRAEYAEAEPLFLRALKLREAAAGPDSADIISLVDSLAYVRFGLKRFADAEPLYERLLALWEKSAGPEHPMVALTLDKTAESFAFQGRYKEAEERATRALALRANIHIASLNQTGRMFLMEARLEDAEDLYRRAAAIGDLAKAPDEVLDPVLRIYSKVLRELKRDTEADALDRRVKEALIRKADREGRRPSPVKPPPPPPAR